MLDYNGSMTIGLLESNLTVSSVKHYGIPTVYGIHHYVKVNM